MSDKILLNETLSALLDHEAGKTDALELRRLVRAMENDPELAARYQRLTLGRAVMRGDALTLSTDFLSRVQHGIEVESGSASSAHGSGGSGGKPWRKALGQFAVAASVAMVAIWYVQGHRVAESHPLALTENITENKKLGTDVDNRLLNPRVLTVSAGNGYVANAPMSDRSADRPSDCIVLEQTLPAESGLYSLQLPDGYVLCRMDDNRQRCHAVSASLACYPR